MKICVIQNNVINDKLKNLLNINKIVPDSILKNVDMLILPEFFCFPYDLNNFINNSEELKEGNLIFNFLKSFSTKYQNLYLVGGSLIEKRGNKFYNTCPVFYNGELICKYSKINLFDIDFKTNGKKIRYVESEILSEGKEPVIFETPFGKIGLGICFDLRFNKLSNYYSENGVSMIIYPGCFTIPTGELHWELLLRSRALDSRCFTIGCSTSRNLNLKYHAYGNSMIVDPYGTILYKLSESQGYFCKDIDFTACEKIKKSIPNNFKCY